MIKAVVIEDDLIWKNKMLSLLDVLDISVLVIADTISAAAILLNKVKPDIVITDVLLGKERIFEMYNNTPAFCKLPTIFVTQSDTEIDYKSAQKVLKHLYIIKPIHKLTLKSAIDNLCKKESPATANNFLPIKGKFNQKIELPFDKIVYIKQNQHYCSIHPTLLHNNTPSSPNYSCRWYSTGGVVYKNRYNCIPENHPLIH